jgi:hypothetical protein
MTKEQLLNMKVVIEPPDTYIDPSLKKKLGNKTIKVSKGFKIWGQKPVTLNQKMEEKSNVK